jgi:hypothetical protein
MAPLSQVEVLPLLVLVRRVLLLGLREPLLVRLQLRVVLRLAGVEVVLRGHLHLKVVRLLWVQLRLAWLHYTALIRHMKVSVRARKVRPLPVVRWLVRVVLTWQEQQDLAVRV